MASSKPQEVTQVYVSRGDLVRKDNATTVGSSLDHVL